MLQFVLKVRFSATPSIFRKQVDLNEAATIATAVTDSYVTKLNSDKNVTPTTTTMSVSTRSIT